MTYIEICIQVVKSFTYESKPLNLKSRIDFILVSRPFAVDAKSAEIRPSVAPDHKATFLSFNIRSELRRGPGTWKFNNSLLKDDKCKELIAFFYPKIHEKYSNVNDKQLLWELIKMEIRAKTIKYSKQNRAELNKREIILQSELQELDYQICNTAFEDLEQGILDKYESTKEELKCIYDQRGKEAMFRSKVIWLEQGEKPTKYFFNLEKTNYEKKLIREVKLENAEVTSDSMRIEKELEKYFTNMYASKTNDTTGLREGNSFESFVEGLEIPKLDKEDNESLEQELTVEELKEDWLCVSHLQKGESTLSTLIEWLNLYVWLGLADYWVNQMTNGNQSRIITYRITEASPFSSNVTIM